MMLKTINVNSGKTFTPKCSLLTHHTLMHSGVKNYENEVCEKIYS